MPYLNNSRQDGRLIDVDMSRGDAFDREYSRGTARAVRGTMVEDNSPPATVVVFQFQSGYT